MLRMINAAIEHLISQLRLFELKKVIGKKKFSLLDIGCGKSSFLSLAQKSGIDVLGIDKSPVCHPKAILSSIEDFELNRKFDVLTMYHLLEHLRKPKEVLEKIKILLKDNGILVIETPLVGNWTEKFLKQNYFAYYDKTHLHFFTKENLFNLLDKTGFQIKKTGTTLFEFPLTVLTASFKQGFLRSLKGIILFPALKILTILGLNEEIIRLYCVKKQGSKRRN